MKKTEGKICIVCGKEFFKKPKTTHKKWENQKCCSKECSHINLKNINNIKKICPICGKEFIACCINKERHIFCSKECQRKNFNSIFKKKRIGNLNIRFGEIKGSAVKRNLEFLIDIDFYKDNIFDKECYYCGEKYDGMGIDRIDNTKGYIKDNCVPCCGKCNSMKQQMTFNEFIEHCNKIINTVGTKFSDSERIKK